MIDNQEFFDKTVEHLAQQGKRSFAAGVIGQMCAYRGKDNTRCAIGYWIPDELYKPEMEGCFYCFKSILNYNQFFLVFLLPVIYKAHMTTVRLLMS